MEIIKLQKISEEVVKQLNKLMPLLDPNCKSLTKEYLQEIVDTTSTILFVAKENDIIVGTLSLVIYTIPTSIKASIEDVVVDSSMRGKGVGEAMLRLVIDYASQLNITKIDLTSNSTRVAANNLYQKLGFEKRETNIYRLNIK